MLEAGSHVFADGSCFEAALPRIRSAGWAVVVTDGRGGVLRAIWGRVPSSLAPGQVAKDGEDYAIIAHVEHTLVSPGVHLYGDCASTPGVFRALPRRSRLIILARTCGSDFMTSWKEFCGIKRRLIVRFVTRRMEF